ncbi:MAG TPA: 16S rRNA (cytosine(1402)-N(4))-methyltransferase RsmH [Caulobacteraceae bacterium]|jgi:16S rRNA (cytosine1402-N4)-methyltransferase|nr:16S rRNA (cytosine(1402)-N(4))-methyltransferase RsmH [Caulobacteraceae bacterium]
MSGPHAPVLLAQVMAALRPEPGEQMVDGTFGAGGYSRAMLDAGANVTAFDRDPAVTPFAAPLAAGGRFRLVAASFSTMAEVLGEGASDGVALDLGVSSMQFDEAERGFSLMRDGPLDMRMSDEGPTAADLVNGAPAAELARIFRIYGEERQARRIAARLCRRREETPFTRTADLAAVVEHALGGRRGAKIHPATRVFQALRIAVNDELSQLEAGLVAAERTLKTGGRLAVVTFHSLEDRIVKSFLTERTGATPAGSRHLPHLPGAQRPSFQLIHKGAQTPGAMEIAANPRARSAKLRAAERSDAPPWRLAA